MVRTRYETPNDIRNEKVALDILLDYLGTGYSWDKGGKRKGLDATLYKDSKPYCLIEVKTRNPKFFSLAQTDGYLIAKQKWDKLLALDARLVVYWLGNDVYALRPSKIKEVIFKQGGRTKQTRDKWDVEQIVLIPWEQFKFIGKKELE